MIQALEAKNVAGSSADAYAIKLRGGTSTARCNYTHGNWGGVMAQSDGNTVEDSLSNDNSGFGFSRFGDSNIVQDNFSGVAADGVTGVWNGINGLYKEGGDGNQFIHNLSSANGVGLFVKSGVTNTVAHDNVIGLPKDETTDLCNLTQQIQDQGTSTDTSGGNTVGCQIIPGCCAIIGVPGITCVGNDLLGSGVVTDKASCIAAVSGGGLTADNVDYWGDVNCDPEADVIGVCNAPASSIPGLALTPLALDPLRLCRPALTPLALQ